MFIEHDNVLLSLATICDVNVLNDARLIALNYHSIGPISIAVYIDKHFVLCESSEVSLHLYQLFEQMFGDIHNMYNITIGIVCINKTHHIYRRRQFDSTTPLMLKIPTNALRNFAEYQINTRFLFNVDIDFKYFSTNSLQNTYVLIKKLIRKFGEKTIFIVPSFEVLHADREEYASLNKHLLRKLITRGEIAPFHANMLAQRCTNYNEWYLAHNYYTIDYVNHKTHCSIYYEPWYIISKSVSQNVLYQWNNDYIGRGLNKVERVMTLRHHCFNFLVMQNSFIIHSKSLHHKKDFTQRDKEKWHEYNLQLFRNQTYSYYSTVGSCSFSLKYDSHCKTGKVSLFSQNVNYRCKVCCPQTCDKCIECEDDDVIIKDGVNHHACCIESIFKNDIYCNDSLPPCILNRKQYCKSDIN